MSETKRNSILVVVANYIDSNIFNHRLDAAHRDVVIISGAWRWEQEISGLATYKAPRRN